MGFGLQSKAAADQTQKSTWWEPRFLKNDIFGEI